MTECVGVSILIYIDMHRAYQTIVREQHPIPMIEEFFL